MPLRWHKKKNTNTDFRCFMHFQLIYIHKVICVQTQHLRIFSHTQLSYHARCLYTIPRVHNLHPWPTFDLILCLSWGRLRVLIITFEALDSCRSTVYPDPVTCKDRCSDSTSHSALNTLPPDLAWYSTQTFTGIGFLNVWNIEQQCW